MNQSQLAKRLGLSPGRVSQLKARGMPIDSLDAARAWRQKNDQRGTMRRGVASEPALASASVHLEKHKPVDPGAPPAEQDPAAAIWRAREAERIAYDQYAGAVATATKSAALAGEPESTSEARARAAADLAPLQSLLRAHGMALSNRLQAERSYEKYLCATGEVAPVEHLMNVLDATLVPLISQLENLAANVAPKANPSSPEIARAAIGAEVETIRRQIAEALERPVPPSPTKG